MLANKALQRTINLPGSRSGGCSPLTAMTLAR